MRGPLAGDGVAGGAGPLLATGAPAGGTEDLASHPGIFLLVEGHKHCRDTRVRPQCIKRSPAILLCSGLMLLQLLLDLRFLDLRQVGTAFNECVAPVGSANIGLHLLHRVPDVLDIEGNGNALDTPVVRVGGHVGSDKFFCLGLRRIIRHPRQHHRIIIRRVRPVVHGPEALPLVHTVQRGEQREKPAGHQRRAGGEPRRGVQLVPGGREEGGLAAEVVHGAVHAGAAESDGQPGERQGQHPVCFVGAGLIAGYGEPNLQR
mmetsp:Transcript_86616/g.232244  ORF Transcript_86616/g.232244 Transcript_86616/m.232244 type:complete len:261 (+) Transcript_86616:1438-2220(+)